MSRIAFNDDNSLKGIEGWHELKSDTLVVYVKCTNSKVDALIDCLAWPVPIDWTEPFGPWCHAGFKRYAYWLTGLIYSLKEEHEFKNIILIGFSMGGGLAQLTGLICEQWYESLSVKVVSIDGPRTTTVLPKDITVYYNCGSFVHSIPPWFKIAKKQIVLNKKFQWFWKSHGNYDIEGIIKEETSKWNQ